MTTNYKINEINYIQFIKNLMHNKKVIVGSDRYEILSDFESLDYKEFMKKWCYLSYKNNKLLNSNINQLFSFDAFKNNENSYFLLEEIKKSKKSDEKPKYIVVKQETIEQLCDQVNLMIKEGYEPLNGFFITDYYNNLILPYKFFQPMIKKD